MNIDENKKWWNTLSLDWKVSLIKNLMFDIEIDLTDEDILERFNNSNFNIDDIVNMEVLSIDSNLSIDLSPIFKLKNLNDFFIIPADVDDDYRGIEDFIYIYPKQLRSKVKKLHFCIPGYFDGDLNSLKDFVNLQEINFQSCHISSLDGIQNLKKLEKVIIDQGNFITDLSPLKGLKIKYLDVLFNEISDLSPLDGLPLEYLNIEGNNINDLSPIMEITTLKKLEFDNYDLVFEQLSGHPSLEQN